MTTLKYIWTAALLLTFASCGASNDNNPLPGEGGGEGGGTTPAPRKQNIFYADPTIFLDNGTYYLSGTAQGGQPSQGFTALQSDNLQEWTSGTEGDIYRLILSPSAGTTWGTTGFWAPQWFKDGGTYYFLYTANEKVAIARADAVTGLFTQKEARPIDASVGNIDPFLFKDDDGTYYLYHVRFTNGNVLWTARFDPQTGALDAASLTQCLELTEPWERMGNYDPAAKVMEGPTVVKWDGVYYLFYSANHYKDPDYAVGYATATSPLGPWTKYEGNPILRRDIVGEEGAGHGDVFQAKDGEYYYVYHVWTDGNPDRRQVRIVPLVRQMGADGVYKISVDADRIITPYMLY